MDNRRYIGHDDTSNDYERFERRQVARDLDARSVDTADMSERSARRLVNELVEQEVVMPVAEARVMLHEPSGESFDSITQLALFHQGWMADRSAGD